MRRRDDENVVLRVLAGDRQAFGLLVDRHRRAAMAAAMARGEQSADAEDVVQEAFVLAYSQLAKLRDPAAFGSWLMRIVGRASASRRRSNARDESARRSLESCVEREAGSQRLEPHQQQLVEAVDALPSGLRDVLTMRYFEERSVAEIADLTGRKPEAVKRQLSRAHRRLRDVLHAEVLHG